MSKPSRRRVVAQLPIMALGGVASFSIPSTAAAFPEGQRESKDTEHRKLMIGPFVADAWFLATQAKAPFGETISGSKAIDTQQVSKMLGQSAIYLCDRVDRKGGGDRFAHGHPLPLVQPPLSWSWVDKKAHYWLHLTNAEVSDVKTSLSENVYFRSVGLLTVSLALWKTEGDEYSSETYHFSSHSPLVRYDMDGRARKA